MVVGESSSPTKVGGAAAAASPSTPPIAGGKSSSPAGKTTASTTAMAPRRASHGGGDADVVVIKEESFQADISARSTGDESNYSSGSDGSVVDQRGQGPERGRGEDELASRSITIQNKRFYLDVKQNSRGVFIKIAEVLMDGSKSRLALSLTSAREFRNHLTQFNEFYAGSQKTNKYNNGRKGSSSSSEGEYGRNSALKSAVIYGNGSAKYPVIGRRRYFLDLKENRRGKFLQVAEASSRAGMATRNRVVIPAQGMIEFRNHLSELLSEYWPSDDASVGRCDEGDISAARGKNFPQPKSLRVHQGKVLYFDSGVNPRGNFLRISQVTTRFRTSILLPKDSLTRVHNMLGDILKEFDAPKEDKFTSSTARSRTSTPKASSTSRANRNAAKGVTTAASGAIAASPLAKVAEE